MLETRRPMAMMAVGVARPVQVRVARIHHSLSILRNISVPAIVIAVAWSVGIRRRRSVKDTRGSNRAPAPSAIRGDDDNADGRPNPPRRASGAPCSDQPSTRKFQIEFVFSFAMPPQAYLSWAQGSLVRVLHAPLIGKRIKRAAGSCPVA